MISTALSDFDGLLSVGGRFAYPEDWYLDGEASKAPPSDRFGIEQAIVEGYLEREKPILGICAGMQMIACLHGCRLSNDVQKLVPQPLKHDERGFLHAVSIEAGSLLANIVGTHTLMVNSLHREAIGEMSDSVRASAVAEDGVIEAIEIPGKTYVLGLQWHQEAFTMTDHPGNGVFSGFVEACSG